MLELFAKYYNTCYPAVEDKLILVQDASERRKYLRVLARTMKKQGNSYWEVILTKGGEFVPKHVYCVKYLKNS